MEAVIGDNMQTSIDVKLKEYDLSLLEKDYDRISVLIDDTKKLNRVCRRINKLTKGAVLRAINSDEYEKIPNNYNGEIFDF